MVEGLVLGTSISSQDRLANRQALSAAAALGPLRLPPGTIEVEYDTAILLPYPTVVGGRHASHTIIDVYPKTLPEISPARTGFFQVTAETGNPLFRGFTIHGPTAANNTGGESPNGTAISWSNSISQGDMTAQNVDITGLFVAGVGRSGKGTLKVLNCNINAWTSPIFCFQSTFLANTAKCIIVGGVHSAYDGEVGSSIGLYIHPHIPLMAKDVRWENFSRYAVYENGSESPSAYTSIVDCEMHDAGMAQVDLTSETTFIRCSTTRSVSDSGTNAVFRGKTNTIDSMLSGRAIAGLLNDQRYKTWNNCIFNAGTINGQESHNFEFNNCTWNLSNVYKAIYLNGAYEGTVKMNNCHIYLNDLNSAVYPIDMPTAGGILDVTGGLTVHTTRTESQIRAGIAGTIIGDITISA